MAKTEWLYDHRLSLTDVEDPNGLEMLTLEDWVKVLYAQHCQI